MGGRAPTLSVTHGHTSAKSAPELNTIPAGLHGWFASDAIPPKTHQTTHSLTKLHRLTGQQHYTSALNPASCSPPPPSCHLRQLHAALLHDQSHRSLNATSHDLHPSALLPNLLRPIETEITSDPFFKLWQVGALH